MTKKTIENYILDNFDEIIDVYKEVKACDIEDLNNYREIVNNLEHINFIEATRDMKLTIYLEVEDVRPATSDIENRLNQDIPN